MYHPIKESDMLDLAAYQDELRKTPVLRYLFLELTDRCNLNCIHCGSKCTENNRTYLEYSIIEKTLSRVADKYNPAEIMICITGGEPFLHPDVYRIIQFSRNLGFSVGITSNGTLIGTKQAKALKQTGLNTIAISIDGIGEVHNSLRGSAHAFEKAMKGCWNLKHAGIEPQALTVVHKDNLFQLEEIFEFLDAEGFYSWRLVNIDPIGRAALQNQLLLDGNDLEYLFDFIRDKRFNADTNMEVTYGCSHFATMEYENEIRDFYFQCGAGTMLAASWRMEILAPVRILKEEKIWYRAIFIQTILLMCGKINIRYSERIEPERASNVQVANIVRYVRGTPLIHGIITKTNRCIVWQRK